MNVSDRMLDANLDRAREGLRVLEDIARFALNDSALSGRLKGLRHSLAMESSSIALLSARDIEGDTAAFLDTESEGTRSSMFSILEANSKRAQESLRVLEEVDKLSPQGAPFKRIRFELYEIEKEMASRLLRRVRASGVRGLYVIVDGQPDGDRSGVSIVRAALAGGARIVQLRDKVREKGLLLPVALALRDLCRSAGALFIVNDHVDLAIAAQADGVHVGQKDLPVSLARRLLPIDMLVGCSTNNVDEARKAVEDGADYVAVGALFPTSSKVDIRPATLDVLASVRGAVSLPVVAIGGINHQNAPLTVARGADAVAVISAVSSALDPEAAARTLVAVIESAKE
ncbi:MAG: thiamine phosphate synthase [Dehalococcoidia bacterium]|nr:thiamine phosphate synthase [Dehalococcoidia bacterium]